MSERIQAPRGTFDVLGDDGARAATALEAHARSGILERAGYERIETPTFEATAAVRARRRASRPTSCRRRCTRSTTAAGVADAAPGGHRAGLPRLPRARHAQAPAAGEALVPGAFFRRERPQKGRYRQFWQVGAEAIGSDDPAVDAESILLLAEILEAIGAARAAAAALQPRHAGHARRLPRRAAGLPARARGPSSSQEVRDRIDLNPLRAFDADHPGTREVMAGAPLLLDRLDDEDREHFEAVKALLDAAGLAYEVDPTLVRGLDYYTRTVFEFTSDALGAQSGVGGGGRYDGLIEQIGGAAHARHGLGRAASSGSCSPRPQPPTAPPPVDLYVAYAKPEHRDDGVPARRRRAPRRPRRAARARRPLPQGPAQAGGPRGRPVRCHPRRRGHGAEGHGDRASSATWRRTP